MTQPFHAYVKETQQEVPVSWSLDIGTLGTLGGSTGLFTANGVVGGVATVTATVGKRVATTTVTVNVTLVDANGVSAADQTGLLAGGALSEHASSTIRSPHTGARPLAYSRHRVTHAWRAPMP